MTRRVRVRNKRPRNKQPNEAPEKPGVVVESGGAVPEIATIADGSSAPPAGAVQQQQTTKIECSRGLADWLIMHNVSLAFTSYQTGQLFLVGVMPDRRISIHQRNFIRAMGLIAQPDRIYVAGLEAVWRMENILRRTEVANQYFDRLFVPRTAQITGDLDVHEMGIDKAGRVIFVNTKYSCLATFNLTHNFRPLWKPKFISKIAPEDRCHLNGMAMVDGTPKYVTAVSRAISSTAGVKSGSWAALSSMCRPTAWSPTSCRCLIRRATPTVRSGSWIPVAVTSRR